MPSFTTIIPSATWASRIAGVPAATTRGGTWAGIGTVSAGVARQLIISRQTQATVWEVPAQLLDRRRTVLRTQPTTAMTSCHVYRGMAFGSAHPAGFHMAMCDGSVHLMSYTIDLNLHHRLGNIADGLPVETEQF